jgi:Pro-kumamolisin, activation domain/MBG domain (YGX type)
MVDRRGGSRLHGTAACLLGLTLVLTVLLISGAGTGTSPAASAAGSGREKLPGHQGLVPPGATLVGPAPTSTSLPLTVTLKPRDPSALAAEVQAVSDPGSPEYHHFLTPAAFDQAYGPTPATIAQVTSNLQQAGLTVGTPSATGLSLPVSGTVAQVQSAFSTPISKYRLSSGKTGYDNATTPEVDTTVAPQIEGILGLDTLSPPQPSTSVPEASQAVAHPAAALAAPALAQGQPDPTGSTCTYTTPGGITTSASGASSTTGALEAPDLAQAYALDPLYAAGDYGSGATIALLEMSGAGYSSSDISTFANCYGIALAPGQVSPVPVDGGSAPGAGTAESELDIETVLSLAPQADIEVYEGGVSDNLYDVFNKIVSDDSAKIVSASWTNGCEAYVGQSFQNSENTLFEAAATEGQTIFVASGDQGAQGCNINGEIDAGTGSRPVAQAVDPSTGTLYVANRSSNTLTVDSEGSTSNPSNFATAGSVSTGSGSGPDAVALDTTAGKVFVANANNNTLTAVSTGSCNQSATSGCAFPTQITSTHLSSPTALAVNGTTLYVANSNGTVAVFSATPSVTMYVTTVTLPASSVPTALAVDSGSGGSVYVADGANARVAYFAATTCNASTITGCSATPSTVSVGNDPVALTISSTSGDLYVANAGTGGGISVVGLSSKSIVKTIDTTQPSNGTGLAQSIGLSPDGSEVLAVLSNLDFPGDVMATVNTSTNKITSTISLQTGTDALGQLVSDGSRNYVWVTDETNGGDVIQNLNLAVSDPASQPDVTSVGGTSLGHGTNTLGPPPVEQAWNDALYYSEGAGGGGISTTFAMPTYQQALAEVTGSTGTPCANAGGDCREVPDVSADADPSSGYIIFDSVNGLDWNALGGTSGAAPLWASVLAVVASADDNTAGYGLLNPALYLLAQKSPGTYLNDVTSGTNDYNATASGEFRAMPGYDMATGLGTPVASDLAAGLTQVPLTVVVSGTQPYGGSPTFSATANYDGSGAAPFGVTLNTSGLTCSTVGTSTAISPSMALGTYTLLATSCSGLALGGPDGTEYSVVYTSSTNDFSVTRGPFDISVSGSQMYGGTPTFLGTSNPTSGVTVSTSGLSCSQAGGSTIAPTLPAGSYALVPASCSGATLSGPNSSNYTVAYTSVAGDFAVTQAPLTITASSGSVAYGAGPPTITPNYSGFVNGDNISSLTTRAGCSTTAVQSSSVVNSPYASTCTGAVDPNYSFSYVAGSVAVTPVALTITAQNMSVPYGTTPTITPSYSGFVPGDSASSLTTQPTCSTPDTGSSAVAGSPYQSSCSGAVDPNYTITYVGGSVTVTTATLTITAQSVSVPFGSTPAVSPQYSGFVAGDTASSLNPQPTCTTTATNTSSVTGSPYPASCSGASDPNYTIRNVAGSVIVTPLPISVAVSGSQANGGPPSFAGTYGSPPTNVTVTTSGLRCSQVNPSTAINGTLTSGSYTLAPTTCAGVVLGGPNGTDYAVAYTTTTNNFTVTGGPVQPTPPPPPPPPPNHGYWLVGSDGGIFTFGSAQFHGSTGNLALQRPVVGISPTANEAGYWLVASDGGVFAFGNAGYYGSIPGTGLAPAGSGLPHSLNAPIVGMVPSSDGGGYFMVASDGGVFAFGDARFEGSCPGMGGCSGAAVAVVPDASGNGYWLVTKTGSVYAFGDAAFYGAPGDQGAPVTSAFRTADGGGYWVLLANGAVYPYGDAVGRGGPVGSVGGFNPASAIFSDAGGGGYWVASAAGAVFAYGDAPNDGSMVGNHLNGSIIAATGF